MKKRKWPNWDISGRAFSYYAKETGTYETGGFTSYFAFEEGSAIIYCRFIEYAP